ncbi:MAG TPA: AtpZ/AtpI family protein [Chloroflexota bacterium]
MKNLSTVQALLIVSQIGFAFAAAVAVGLLAGGWLDSVLHTSPLFVVLGALAGTGAGIASAVQLARFGTKPRDDD